MCGLFGLVHSDRDAVHRALGVGTTAIAHRGPDDWGQVISSFGSAFVGLGHRRLSILDLSPLGHQPMIHPESGSRLIFNGEIYNFKVLRATLEREGESFKSNSDTEVLLAGLSRHGPAFLPCLEGMFALAFLDPRKGTLLLARDPAGIKPLYLADLQGSFLFASESRAILATGLVAPKLDRRGLATYLAYGAVQDPLTAYEEITSLPAGSHFMLRVRADGGWSPCGPPELFWRLPPPQVGVTGTEAIEGVQEIVEKAFQDHLLADVPVALFLSSGIDSTILAGLASKHAPALKSFTVIFKDDPNLDEERVAAETAMLFGLDHSALTVDNLAATCLVKKWLSAIDQPSIDGLNVFVISKAVQEQGIKVALTGLGADELFGGYPSFREVPKALRFARLMKALPSSMRRGLATVATIGRSQVVRSKMADMLGGEPSLRSMYLGRRRLMSDSQMTRLGLHPNPLGLTDDYLTTDATPDVDTESMDAVRVISQLEFRLYQGNMLLRDADVNGMACGIELRVPFLDRRLLDFVHALPGAVRLPPRAASKYLLRKAFSGMLRPSVVSAKKRGFTLPIGRWMVQSLRTTCEDALTALCDSQLLDSSGVSKVWKRFLAEPESPMWSRAFALVVLGQICRR
jgi:asparagine synthase (glutamine-hydrolysing)